MLNNIIVRFLPIIVILGVWLVFSAPFFFSGDVPYPSRFQSSFFPPWSDYHAYVGPVKNSAMPDVITQIYPWRMFTIEELSQGRIPLWNPYSFAGTPHLANYQSAVFFPLNILFFIPIGFVYSWSLLVLLQPLLAGMFMYFFLRSLSIEKSSSVLGSLAFMFSGFIVSWMSYATLGYAIAFLPLALFAINSFFSSKRIRYLMLLAVCIPCSFFAGHFQISLYFLLGVIFYALFFGLLTQSKRSVSLVFVFIIGGILLTLPQLLPTVEFYSHSVRQDIVQKIEVVPLGYLPTLFSPDFFGNPVTRNDWFGHYAEWNGYSGIVPLILALSSAIFLIKRDKKVAFLAILGLCALLLAFNTPLNDLLFRLKLPVVSTSASSRIIVLFSFSVASLAAIGFMPFLDFIRKRQIKPLGVLLFITFGIFVVLWFVPLMGLLPDSEKNLIARNNMLLPSLILAGFAVCSACLFVFRKNGIVQRIVPVLIIGIVAVDVLRFAMKWQPFDPKEFVFPDVGVTRFYESTMQDSRTLGKFTAENTVYYRLLGVGGYDPLYPERFGELMKYVASGRPEPGERSVVNFSYDTPRTERIVDLLGIMYIPHKKSDTNQPWSYPFSDYPVDKFGIVYEDNAYQVYRNNAAYPRPFLVNDYAVEDSGLNVLHAMFNESTNLKETVILEADPNVALGKGERVELTEYTPTSVKVNVVSDGNSLLVLTDNFYPGWKAYINGMKTELYRANYTFRAIVVPDGNSQVEFKYEPGSFQYGIYMAILGIIILIGGGIVGRKMVYDAKN